MQIYERISMYLKHLLMIVFVLVLNAYASAGQIAAELANDAYLCEEDFKTKYKESALSITASISKSVHFYTLHTRNNTLIVTFRGSRSFENWESNLNIGETQFLDVKGAIVHQGFYEEALGTRTKLAKVLDKNQKVIVTGHSLGGAVALVFAAMLQNDGFDVKLITFGSPPVGNQTFVDSIKALDHIRYTHIFDIVPKVKKEYVDKFKLSLSNLNEHFKEGQKMKSLLGYIGGISYDYIHHGRHRSIYNLESLDSKYDNELFVKKFLLNTLLYHSSKTYLNGVK